jgi:predicted nucleic acid-binding protein
MKNSTRSRYHCLHLHFDTLQTAKAERDFDSLSNIKNHDKRYKAFLIWMDTYVSDEGRKRYVDLLRRKRAVKRDKLRGLSLKEGTYRIVKWYAKKKGLTLNDAIHQAIAPLYKAL